MTEKIRSQVYIGWKLGSSAGFLGYSVHRIDRSRWLKWFGHKWNSIRHVPLDTDSEPGEEIFSHSGLGMSRRSWNVWLGIEKYGLTISACYHSTSGSKRQTNEWMGKNKMKNNEVLTTLRQCWCKIWLWTLHALLSPTQGLGSSSSDCNINNSAKLWSYNCCACDGEYHRTLPTPILMLLFEGHCAGEGRLSHRRSLSRVLKEHVEQRIMSQFSSVVSQSVHFTQFIRILSVCLLYT